jgi:hypothetical protein
MSTASISDQLELPRIEADLAGAYEAAWIAARTGELSLWEDDGGKVAAALSRVRCLLQSGAKGPGQHERTGGPSR